MPIDTSMYQNMQLPDFVGSYMRGNDWRSNQNKLKKEKETDDAMKGIYTLGPDGRMIVDQAALKNFSQVSPEGAYKIQRDLDDARIREQSLIDERNYKKDMLAATRSKQQEKSAEMSASEAKQLGLFKMGAQAEQQYRNAVSDKKEYDPTSPGQWIDNSDWAPAWLKNDKANQAGNAQSAWVESYLRDASGAAIPPSERMAYAKDFFPRPGDSEAVLANKENLRKQKMENALVASGGNPSMMANFIRPSIKNNGGAGGSWGGGIESANAGNQSSKPRWAK